MEFPNTLVTNTPLTLTLMKKELISETYVSWLNDKKLMQYSNQRFFQHSKETCIKFLETFDKSSNIFLAIINENNSKLKLFFNIDDSSFILESNNYIIDLKRTTFKGSILEIFFSEL